VDAMDVLMYWMWRMYGALIGDDKFERG